MLAVAHGTASSPARATPPIVRNEHHAFDPDWIEVWWTLRQKCRGCHRPGTERHDLTSYAALLGGGPDGDMPVVIPGSPEESLLFEQVLWNHASTPDSPHPDMPSMPPDRMEWLSAGQLEAFERWIRNGARQYRRPPVAGCEPLLEIHFPSAKECAACHPRQYEQWSRSMHAYAQHSPVFEAFTLTMIERTGGTIGTFCTRCHTPIGVSLGETGSTRNVCRSRLSMEGITCVVCHRMAQPYYKSSGRIPVTPGQVDQGCLYGPFVDPVPVPGGHAAGGNEYLLKSEFCGSCHDVTSPQGVRLEEAFSEWQNSPAAKEGHTCQHCHMGPIQGVPIARLQRPWGKAAVVPGIDPASLPDRPLSDHTFAGPDYSLLPDTEFPHKLDWMYEQDYRDTARLSPHQRETLTRLRIRNRSQLERARFKRYELLRNAARLHVDHPDCASTGDRIRIRVDVESLFAGHNLPTGFTAERQVWVELAIIDPLGRLEIISGGLDRNGDLLDEHSHEVEAGHLHADHRLLNFQSKFVSLTAQGTERTVIIPVNRHLAPLNVIRPPTTPAQSFGRPPIFRVAKSSLPPLQTAGRTYHARMNCGPGRYTIRVRLNFRNLPPALFDKIGIPHLKHLLETVVIDEYAGHVEVK
ncbi:multiheme c-type cytochrome [Maioricimonas rarisocia]|uniref:multiheme c-type cytochrome n=1 Tax=Maioricimonas rarisocia TaxID=2528026 RepID=UPI0018D20B9B|nr:multiheme c-type cytochrome [Maioricimonas rarisocia]